MELTKSWVWAAAAVVAAVAAGLLAPAPWPSGDARVQVDYRGRRAIDAAVTVDSLQPLVVGDADLRVVLPDGVRSDAATRVAIRAPVRPALDELQVTILLPDGRRELVPVLGWNEEEESLVAARRPPVRVPIVLGLLAMVVVLWVTETVPLFATSLLVPVVLVVAGVAPARDALAPFFHPIIALFFGGFLMAEAMRRVGLDHRAAITIVARAGKSPVTLFAALLGVSAFLSMWMSNTAAAAVLVPIALAITEPLEHAGFKKAVVLGIAYAATIGGAGSAIGTPANPLAIEFLATFVGKEISFLGWFAYGLPLVVLFLPVMGIYLWRRSGVRLDRETFAAARRRAVAELERAGRLTRGQLTVLLVFVGVVALWLTQTLHRLDTGIVALMGAAALALLGKIKPVDLRRISWEALMTFGGGLTLGTFLVETGTSDWLATRLGALAALPALLAVGAVATLALALTTVASNTATAAMLVPLAIPLAGVLGLDPTLLVVVVAMASSIDFALVIGTPPTMIAYSTRLYSVREIFKTGFALDIAGIVILVGAVVGLWTLFGLL